MTDLATVLASLVLVVTEGTVEGSKLAKLVALELVLSFGNGRGLAEESCQHSLPIVIEKVGGGLTVSMTLWMSFLALLTFSSVSAMMRQ
ncbi:uncharacterized protein BDZ83DRAFT_54194 [Colletotrichum acutatum]|uniref:Uncharacterized protein n=1 Tax=Glomerella acutata TaxID=27357 RepID=A0AAD8UF41_GLOAC|nr:uncharacterized protein BDZ83DRAFT_54194 [Colletotrichum acutatum]KAK1715567.1 hypothetical protein BDZ83DRAFT_54194 [Colletotrichum acutatum]